MNTYSFILNKNQKIYEQIYQRIKHDILEGILKYNDKLPSKRILKESLKVSIHSIETAYLLLLDEGLIYSKERSGYFVSNIRRQKENILAINKENQNDIIYNFKTQGIDFSLFNQSSMLKLSKQILSNSSYLKRSEYKGFLELRKSISNYLYETKDIKVSEEQIIIQTSTYDMIQKLISILNIKTIGIEDPGYHKILNGQNVEVNYLRLDNEGVMIKDINHSDLIIVTPYAQYPTGIKMSLKRKNELIEYAEKNNCYIIEDAFDSNLKNNSVSSVSLFSLSDNVIYMESFSRTLYPGLCLSFMVLPPKLLKSFEYHFKDTSSNVSSYNQILLKLLFESGIFYRHINKLRQINKKKKEKIISLLDKNLFTVLKNNNYISILCKINKEIDISEFKKKLIQNKIAIEFIDELSKYKNYKNIIMLGYSQISLDKISEGITLLSSLLKD